jgi:hypothetical protein
VYNFLSEMTDMLFSPRKMDIPGTLVLIPHFHDRVVFDKLRNRAEKSAKLLGSRLLLFQEYALMTGFLGYPYLLTLLEFISDVKQKRILFLGTAGSLNRKWDPSHILNITRIHAGSIFSGFSSRTDMELIDLGNELFPRASAVSVDIPQRETPSWLALQQGLGIDAVEMELFPLRVYLDHPFVALVVLSDRVTERGIKVFSDQKHFSGQFVSAFEYIEESIHKSQAQG